MLIEFSLIIIIIGSIYVLFIIFSRWSLKRRHNHSLYVCLDGHIVRSRGEWMIDVTLQHLGIPHQYEPRLQFRSQTLHPDFGLGNDIYLEFWGLKTKAYLNTRKKKQEIYKSMKISLINLNDHDLHNLLYTLVKKLQKYKEFLPNFHKFFELNRSITIKER